MYTKKLYLKLLTTLFFFTFTNMIMGSEISEIMGSEISEDKEYEKELIKKFKPKTTYCVKYKFTSLAEATILETLNELIHSDREATKFLEKILDKETVGNKKIVELNLVKKNCMHINWNYFIRKKYIESCFEKKIDFTEKPHFFASHFFANKKNIYNEIYHPTHLLKDFINNEISKKKFIANYKILLEDYIKKFEEKNKKTEIKRKDVQKRTQKKLNLISDPDLAFQSKIGLDIDSITTW